MTAPRPLNDIVDPLARQRERTSLDEFLPSGDQLALPVAGTQLGLDGRSYEPRREATPYLGTSHRLFPATPAGTPEPDRSGSAPGTRGTRGTSPELGTGGGVGLVDDTEQHELAELTPLNDDVPLDDARAERCRRIGVPATQLELPIALFESAPQLSMFAQLYQQQKLFSGTTATTLDGDFVNLDRDAKCQRFPFVKQALIEALRSSSGSWSVRNVISCGRMTCPVCGRRIARDTASKLAVVMQRHMSEATSDAWLMTCAPPHYIDDDPRESVQRLQQAHANFVRDRDWRRFARDYGVQMVRVLDSVHGGPNGVHAHWHYLLLVQNARIPRFFVPSDNELAQHGKRKRRRWSANADAAERAREDVDEAMAWWLSEYCSPKPLNQYTDHDLLGVPIRMAPQEVRAGYLRDVIRERLLPAWERACRAAGIRIKNPTDFRRHSLDFTPSEKAHAYFTKWGLADEVGASTLKQRSHLRLLDLVAAGCDAAGDMFRQWRVAVHGVAWVTGLKKVCDRYNVTDEDARAYVEKLRERRRELLLKAGKPLPPEVRPIAVVIRPELHAVVFALGWAEVFAFVDELGDRADDEVQRELNTFLWRALARVPRGPPERRRHGNEST